jgi:hypothetical protein
MREFTEKDAKIKAGAPCGGSNISKRGNPLVKAENLWQELPHKGPASQEPAKLKSAHRLEAEPSVKAFEAGRLAKVPAQGSCQASDSGSSRGSRIKGYKTFKSSLVHTPHLKK